ncbi:MAG: aminoacetone oxidase family FAD-binding enzyme [Bacteroidales bacterium]|nr:aminoacetone oxidase family FAD-binding enzyme [Bacteroidales bacterium]
MSEAYPFRVAAVGGGAAGFFFAVNLKEMLPEADVTVFESTDKVLSKVLVSGGGRCNCTNSFENISDLSLCYPRGSRLMKRLFNVFSPRDAYRWFESHGVKLKTEPDGRVFPLSDDSRTIVNMFLHLAAKYDIHIRLNSAVESLEELQKHYNAVCLTTGGTLHGKHINTLIEDKSVLINPVASLFGLKTDDTELKALSGVSIDEVCIKIPQTKIKSCGSVLMTRHGISGPCVLKLTGYAARFLNERNYKTKLLVNWAGCNDVQAVQRLSETVLQNGNKTITNYNCFSLPQRFWHYIVCRTMPLRTDIKYKDLTKKEINRLADRLCNSEVNITGRAAGNDEFVTCGGVDINAVDCNTMQLKTGRNIFLAGEVLDADGITGGFNFQAAWTTAYVAALGVKKLYKQL